jgi:cytochrome c-type biogenesis protein CcmH/NrfF
MVRAVLFGSVLFAGVVCGSSARADDMEMAPNAPRADAVARALDLDLRQKAAINDAQEADAKQIGLELTCLCGCAHRTIQECDCGSWAEPGRQTIRLAIAKGMTHPQIIDTYRKVYGDKVLSMLPNEGFGKVAWILPYTAGIVGLVMVFVFGFRYMRPRPASTTAESEAARSTSADRGDAKKELMRELEEMD